MDDYKTGLIGAQPPSTRFRVPLAMTTFSAVGHPLNSASRCSYPKATMDLVNELSFGIVQEYRERQKGRLQRTFVSGSAAAAGKVNRAGPAGGGGKKP